MLRINTDSGQTLSLDLAEDADARKWEAFRRDHRFQGTIRAISVYAEGRLFALPMPRRFRRISWEAELLVDPRNGATAERVVCQADAVRLILTVRRRRNAPVSARVDLERIGELRHSPWNGGRGAYSNRRSQ
jgi:hypothetical protein